MTRSNMTWGMTWNMKYESSRLPCANVAHGRAKLTTLAGQKEHQHAKHTKAYNYVSNSAGYCASITTHVYIFDKNSCCCSPSVLALSCDMRSSLSSWHSFCRIVSLRNTSSVPSSPNDPQPSVFRLVIIPPLPTYRSDRSILKRAKKKSRKRKG